MKKLRWTLFCFNLAVVALLCCLYWSRGTHNSRLSIYGNAPDFTLTESSGREFSSSLLKGQVWIGDFIFTRCAGQCPILSGQMVHLQSELKKEVALVSFTVDPDYDTPKILADYARSYGADPAKWFFLTGPKAAVVAVMKQFHVAGTDEPAIHSVSFVLVDRKGRIRGYYDATDSAKTKQILLDTQKLLSE